VITCGQELRVDIRPGSGNKPPLLLLSGIGISYEVFDELIPTLDRSVEIIRIDVPGVGGSPEASLPYGFPQLAGLLARMLDDLGHRQVDILGFSWGGALAQQFALQFPSRCRRLVLISTSTGALSIPGDYEVLTKMLAPQHFRELKEVRALLRGTRVATSPVGYAYQLGAVICWTSLPFLRLIRQPTLVLGGDDDPIVPLANARLLAGLIPHAELHVFPGGHIDPLIAPQDVGPIITRFLT